MVFKDRPLLDVAPDFDAVEAGQLDDFKLTQLAPGAGTPWKGTTKLRRSLKLPFLLNKTQWRALRDFFAVLGGMQRGFWLPLWLTDYDSTSQLQGGTAIIIRGINLAGAFVAGEQFAFGVLIERAMAIGQVTLEPYEIASVAALGGDDEQLNLTAPIAGDFDPERSVCGGLIYCRLSADPVRWQYITDRVVRCELDFTELSAEYGEAVVGTTPIFLYEFTRAGKTWRMTNWPEPLVIDDECWSPDNIKHGEMRSAVDVLPEDLILNVGTDMPDHPLRYYLARSAFEVTELQIWETNAEALPFVRSAPLYKGRVGKVEFRDEGEIQVRCSSLLRLAEQTLPRMQVQRTCNHRFGDENCGKSLAVYEVAGTLLIVTEDYVEANEFATEAAVRADAQWFALGKVIVGDETRMVVGQDGGKLYVDEPFNAAVVGDEALAYPGCNKRVSHCVGRYANIARAMMFPYVPNINPVQEMLTIPKTTGGKK